MAEAHDPAERFLALDLGGGGALDMVWPPQPLEMCMSGACDSRVMPSVICGCYDAHADRPIEAGWQEKRAEAPDSSNLARLLEGHISMPESVDTGMMTNAGPRRNRGHRETVNPQLHD